jgi:hypothetical protein
MSDGQGPSAPGTLDDLANFLADTPEADSEPALEEEGQTADEPEEDNSDAETTDDAPADEEESSEDAKEPTSDVKYTVTVKGEDGADQTIEVDQKELISGYQRHADYTRKAMELSTREREVTQAVATKLQEGQNYYLEQAQMAHAAVRQLAGLRTPEEMAALAHSDPASWVAESQRQASIQRVLQQIEQGTQQERQQIERQQQEQKQQAYSKAWEELSKDGLDRPKLKAIFDTMKSKYQVPDERLANVMDPVLVRIMRDAAAYQALQDKKPAVMKKVQEAPKLPAARQAVPRQEQRNKALDAKFSSGKAKLKDLAAYLANN